ncbi:DUF2490 domain-containing protein [Flavihumibacter solisilvae]|uniref:Outer membrane protein beta-barrel domain-containing protein n=1 Tax=Flavihumibacter solisilvae TaxID=1349421 RepID=A0A0C1LLA8_9BACT|nr:DUF2490 domain-containing protein [Flavihumibacter solisilvae]KIC96128.1 hypothetical protein OI18_02900 [Flavihumibacter solisilvae]
MNKFLVLSLLCIGLQASVYSQKTNTGWLASFNTITISKKFSLHADIQFRSGDDFNTMQSLLLRPGLNYKISSRVTATAGYAYILNRRSIDEITGYAPEHRTWQQLLVSQSAGPLAISHRVRMEQRFISKTVVDGDELKQDGNIYANRFRYFFRGVLPFNGSVPFTKGVFAAVQDEIFLNVGNNSAVNGRSFDQNRAYLALGYRLSRRLDLEGGYLNQYIQGRGDSFTNNHVIQLAVYTRF